MNGDNPIVIEIDPASWQGHLDNVEPWLGTTLTNQTAFRQLLEKVAPMLREPHFRKFVTEQAEIARRHESEAERFYTLIGRDPSSARKKLATIVGTAKQAGAEANASSGGAEGTWLSLQALVPAALDA